MKLPINPLLHLISLTALAGIVMSFLDFRDNEARFKVQQKRIASDIKKLSVGANGSRNESGRWDYNSKAFWQHFAEVNFTGRVKRVETEVKDEPEVKPAGPADAIDLNEILTVIAITRGADRTGAVVNYTATVEVPEEYVVAPTTAVMSSIPAGRRNRGAIPKLPTPSAGSSPPHHLKIGDPLWPPYAHVFLQKVAIDASAVLFELRVASTPKGGKYPTQEILRNELGLPVEVLTSLRSGGGKTATTDKTGSAAKADTSDARGGYKWQDKQQTFVDRRGNVNISRKDSRWLRQNGSQVFNEDVSMRDYSSRVGTTKVRGIQLRKLSPRVRQFGAREGDVVISVNNQPVKGMAHAKRLGQRLYNRGVRSYKVEVLRRGERQFLTFHLEDKE